MHWIQLKQISQKRQILRNVDTLPWQIRENEIGTNETQLNQNQLSTAFFINFFFGICAKLALPT